MNKSDYFDSTGRFMPIHQHLVIRAISDNPITDEQEGKQFLLDLVSEIEMTPVTEPQSVNVRSLGNEGLTGSINLSNSHIAYHCWEETGLLQLDVYSCTCFDVLDTLQFIKRAWGLSEIRYSIINREDLSFYDFKVLEM